MGNSLRDALRKAAEEKGTNIAELLPGPVRIVDNRTRHRSKKPKRKKNNPNNPTPHAGKVNKPKQRVRQNNLQQQQHPTPAGHKPDKLWEVSISDHAKVSDKFEHTESIKDFLTLEHDGVSEQPTKPGEDIRDMVMGFDFGTSTTKVVIADRIQKKAFAVRFFEGVGINRYLIATHIYNDQGVYSLEQGSQAINNLKLPLMEKSAPDNKALQAAVAYVALVIRRARGWLFSQHADIYDNTKMYWRFTLGIPSENYKNQDIVGRYTKIAKAAWLVASSPTREITENVVQDALNRYEQSDQLAEIDVVPELSAQIYGFVQSQRFDPKKPNIFLLADIGAGTLDSSVFQVRKGRGGKWDFEFFTAQVGYNGVTALHKARIDWWKTCLENEASEQARALAIALDAANNIRSLHSRIPEKLDGYIDGATINFTTQPKPGCSYPEGHPDGWLLNRSGLVMQQVRGYTFFKAKDYMEAQNLDGIPLFLCGGGSRMESYDQNICSELASFPSVPWLRANKSLLEIPINLDAPSVMREDYDRLSAAYGLSFLEIGEIIRAMPKPKVLPKKKSYEDNYISKEMV
jgi:hypothetical protein